MTLPRVQPIIPISSKEPFDDPDWLFEFKYDGFRGLLYAGEVRIRVKPYGGHGRQFERDDDLVGRYSGQCMSYFSRNLSCQFYRDGYDRGKV
jgi:hypothetical protein